MRWWPRRKVYLDNLPKTHDLRFAVVFLVGLAAVFAALYGVGYAVAGDTVPRGTTVSDVEVGTMTRGEAETALRAELVPRIQRPLSLESPAGTFRIDPQIAGVTLDVEGTVHEAMAGGDWDPRHMLRVVFGGSEVDPVLEIDDDELRAALTRIEKQVRVRPRDSAVLFTSGRPQVRYGTVGETVDLERLKESITEALREDVSSIRLPMQPVPPVITRKDATTFVRDVARPATARPVWLRVRRSDVTLSPPSFASALRAPATPEGLRLGIDAAAAYRLGAGPRSQLPGQPTDARVVLRGSRPVVVPGEPGFRITPKAWADGVLAAALEGPGNRVARVEAVDAPPSFTAADARAMRITSRIAVSAARFPASVDRRDAARAARQIDGAVLRPGARLSFLRRVQAINQPLASSVVATATYNAALKAGLDVPDRSWMPRLPGFLPRGREALVLRPRDDLVLENQLPYGVLLDATVEPTRSGGVVRVEAWGTRYWRVELRTSRRLDLSSPPPFRRSGPDCRPRAGVPGFRIELTRVRDRDDRRRVEVYSSRYLPERGVVCGPVRGGQR